MWPPRLISDWFYSWLEYFGFLSKKGNILILGLDNAGKTTLLGFLSTGKDVLVGGVEVSVCDLGGHRQARRVWGDYCLNTGGIVFMVDTTDTARLGEAGAELRGLVDSLEQMRERKERIPILVMGNKADHPLAVSETVLVQQLGIYQMLVSSPTMRVFMVSVVRNVGLADSLQWLTSLLP